MIPFVQAIALTVRGFYLVFYFTLFFNFIIYTCFVHIIYCGFPLLHQSSEESTESQSLEIALEFLDYNKGNHLTIMG